MALSLPPFGLWPLALAGAALLPWAVNGRSPGGRAGSGFLAGVGQLVIGLAWADKFTFLGYGALVILQSAIFALACALAPGGRARVPALAAVLDPGRVCPRPLAIRRRATRAGSSSDRRAGPWRAPPAWAGASFWRA